MISALLVNYRCHAQTLVAVDSVLADCPAAQVIVVDNSESEAEAAALQARLPTAVTLRVSPTNLGFGRACNLALQEARHDRILLLNPDAWLLPGCLEVLGAELDRHPQAGAVSPMSYWDADRTWRLPPNLLPLAGWDAAMAWAERVPWWRDLVERRYETWVERCHADTRGTAQAMLSGGHMLIRRTALEAAGGLFDPAYFMYFEDAELCLRLRRAGWQLRMQPRAAVVHRWINAGAKLALFEPSARVFGARHPMRRPWQALQAAALRRPVRHDLAITALGVLDRPPCIDLPADLPSAWQATLAQHVAFVPAAHHDGVGRRFELPADIDACLGPGRYLLCIRAGGRRLRYSWDKPG